MKIPSRVPNLRPAAALLLILNVLPLAATTGCGPKIFPKCGEPGVDCPPCRGDEVYPDPCAAARRDGGAEAGK